MRDELHADEYQSGNPPYRRLAMSRQRRQAHGERDTEPKTHSADEPHGNARDHLEDPSSSEARTKPVQIPQLDPMTAEAEPKNQTGHNRQRVESPESPRHNCPDNDGDTHRSPQRGAKRFLVWLPR